ncbi:MAG: type IV pilus modification protein PilV [Pseudomonadota bacterium]
MRHTNQTICSHKASEQGFTLVEILVAMLVLAIGMLGIAALQLRGLQYNHDAYLRSQINLLAYDIADRMRLNSDNAATYASTQVLTTTRPSCTVGIVSVANDLNCWYQQGYDALPPGSEMDIVADASGTFSANISWSDRDGVDTTVSYTFMP